MAIALLLVSILSGFASAGAALYMELGWLMAFGAYVAGGMIASGCTVALAVTARPPRPAMTGAVRKPVS